MVKPPSFVAGRAPLFLLSFRYRDELIDSVERAGWQAIAARRADAIEQRFTASGATIVVVDGRGAMEDGLRAARKLATSVEANGGALLFLLSSGEIGRLDEVHAAGATHFLASPFGAAEFTQALRFAARHVSRMGGGESAAEQRAQLLAGDEQWWRWSPREHRLEFSPALAARLPEDRRTPLTALRMLDKVGRKAALQTLRRVYDTGRAGAFAHDMAGHARRIAQHLYLEPQSGAIVARIEDLSASEPVRTPGRRDPLTGLPDRPGALRWIANAMEQCDGEETGCILLLMSILRFDAINTTYGRATGDALLRAVARRIERLVSGFESRRYLVARVAGAEFAIGLLGPPRKGEAFLLAEQLGEAVSRPFVSGDNLITFNCRMGGTEVEPGEHDPAQLLRRASTALAEAKDSEGGTPQLLDASGHARSEVASRLEIDLRAALEQDQIEVLFQPQLSITTGEMVGVEALARWRHPLLGELGAGPLFAAAERSDYLVALSRHVQRKALATAAAHGALFAGLRLSINVTAADIAQPDFVAQFLALVDEHGIARDLVTVEVTESGLIEDLGNAAMLLARLREAGLRVAIDDFGTGYSSLAYLKALPLDYLKIDPQLSQDIAGSSRDRVVVTGVVEMARSLGLSVVAEGVENETQLSLLAEAGCNFYQGFIFSPPVAAEALGRLKRA